MTVITGLSPAFTSGGVSLGFSASFFSSAFGFASSLFGAKGDLVSFASVTK